MKKFIIGFNIFFLTNFFILSELQPQIKNEIIVRVGGLIISSFDVQNEIITNLVLNKQEISQENINAKKNFAIKNLINKTVKNTEIQHDVIIGIVLQCSWLFHIVVSANNN
mgnify:CR=1 FL=1